MKVQENEAEMRDNYFTNMDSKTRTFYSIGEKTNKIAPETSVDAVFKITFTLDELRTQYERVRYRKNS